MKTNAKTPKKWQPKALASAIACAYLTLALVPAYASDTEIYVEAANQTSIAPNLMMMFDTSGSMAWCMENDNGCSAPNRRIDVLKDAMNKILRGTPTTKPVLVMSKWVWDVSIQLTLIMVVIFRIPRVH